VAQDVKVSPGAAARQSSELHASGWTQSPRFYPLRLAPLANATGIGRPRRRRPGHRTIGGSTVTSAAFLAPEGASPAGCVGAGAESSTRFMPRRYAILPATATAALTRN